MYFEDAEDAEDLKNCIWRGSLLTAQTTETGQLRANVMFQQERQRYVLQIGFRDRLLVLGTSNASVESSQQMVAILEMWHKEIVRHYAYYTDMVNEEDAGARIELERARLETATEEQLEALRTKLNDEMEMKLAEELARLEELEGSVALGKTEGNPEGRESYVASDDPIDEEEAAILKALEDGTYEEDEDEEDDDLLRAMEAGAAEGNQIQLADQALKDMVTASEDRPEDPPKSPRFGLAQWAFTFSRAGPLGIMLKDDDGFIKVDTAVDGYQAASLGVQSGDTIVSVDEVIVQGMTVSEVKATLAKASRPFVLICERDVTDDDDDDGDF